MRLIRAKRASEILSVSLQRLYELARLGIIPVVRLGPRQIRFDENALTEWARNGGAISLEIKLGKQESEVTNYGRTSNQAREADLGCSRVHGTGQ